MAVRVPPTLDPPADCADALHACMAAKPLQHQDELTMLLRYLLSLEPSVMPLGTIVEIGSFRGGTLELWARLAHRQVISIDLPTEQFYGSANTVEMMEARDVVFRQRFPHVHSLLSNSHDPATVTALQFRLAGQPIDLLFIDGDHTPEGVRLDYEMYSPLVRPGGVVAFHDILWCDLSRVNREQFGVPAFFDSLPDPKHRFCAEGGYWGGIGVIRR